MDDHASARRHVQISVLAALVLLAVLMLANPGALKLGRYTILAPIIAITHLRLRVRFAHRQAVIHHV